MRQLRIKRIYEPRSSDDGMRLLVDRMWPRGVSKAKAELDEWLRSIAPSPDLCKWFGHRPDRFEEFRARYRAELTESPEQRSAVERVLRELEQHDVTLLYAARDPVHNHAQVLLQYLEEHRPEREG
ncbi:DUF488 domain-containing protein [Alicyclobacillus contaminans]|uniref:DUF488 domain-containing protein n=1 Tax=Alicyclobacillus contaminans TaxID=392016 RepID=UPI00047BF3BC|nr:DUF488 domain-containing protein [Alicyclobacillus contaminans]